MLPMKLKNSSTYCMQNLKPFKNGCILHLHAPHADWFAVLASVSLQTAKEEVKLLSRTKLKPLISKLQPLKALNCEWKNLLEFYTLWNCIEKMTPKHHQRLTFLFFLHSNNSISNIFTKYHLFISFCLLQLFDHCFFIIGSRIGDHGVVLTMQSPSDHTWTEKVQVRRIFVRYSCVLLICWIWH